MEVMVIHQILEKAYKGKKVFVTGHTGFKGAWLLKTLSMLGAQIKGYALDPYTPNDLFCLINGEALCHSEIGDIRDKNNLEKSILDFQPDYIFHLAAQPLVRLSYEIPTDTYEVNVSGTANLLDAVRKLSRKCSVVLITTDKVYKNREWIYPYREDDRLGGYDPYSASKACAELVIDSYRDSFFNSKDFANHNKGIAVARAGNVIGGGDWSKDRLIPDIVRALIADENILIRNPNSIRPWQHVLEPLVGYLLLGLRLNDEPIKFSQAYNFGPKSDDVLSVEQILNMFIQVWGSGTYKCEQNLNSPHEAGLLKLDISKVTNELSWNPKLAAEETIKFTADWYRNFDNDRENISNFTLSQIQNYLGR